MMKNRTKLMFAGILEKTLKEIPMDKVRVVGLCAKCGAAPPTFYYYFRDKYELVAWMLMMDLSEGIQEMIYGMPFEKDTVLIRKIEERKAFYQKALNEQSQKAVLNYITSFNLDIVRKAGHRLTPEEQTRIRYYCHGLNGILRDWLFGEGIRAEDLARVLRSGIPDFLEEAYVEQGNVNEIMQNRSNRA